MSLHWSSPLGQIFIEIISDGVWLLLLGITAFFGFLWVARKRRTRLHRFFGPDHWNGLIRIRLSNVYVVQYGTRSFAGRDKGAFGPAATTGEFRAATEFEKEMYRPARRTARILQAVAGELGGEVGKNAARPVLCQIRPSPLYFDEHGQDGDIPKYQKTDNGVAYRHDFEVTGDLARKCLEQMRGSLVVAGSDVYNMLSGYIQWKERRENDRPLIWWQRIPKGEVGKHGENMTERVLMVAEEECRIVPVLGDDPVAHDGYIPIQRRKTAPTRGGQYEPFYIRKITDPRITGGKCVIFLCEGTSTASTGAAMVLLALNWDKWEKLYGREEFALVYDVEATKLEPNEPDDLIPENKPRLRAHWPREKVPPENIRWVLREEGEHRE